MSDNTGRYSGKPTGGNPWGPGVKNGRIALARMRLMTSQPHFAKGTPAGYLYPPAAILVDRMTVDARADRVRIHVIVGYRPYAQQVVMWDYYEARHMRGYAARPGTSTHGLAVTIDIERRAPGTEHAVAWMKKNATRYGFDHPRWAGDGVGTEEPWHWQLINDFQPAEEAIRWSLENGDAFLRLGERDAGPGGHVALLQDALRAWSLERPDVELGDHLKVDGWFGQQTRDLVELFQTMEHILPKEKALRGVAGPTTRGRLAVVTGKVV